MVLHGQLDEKYCSAAVPCSKALSQASKASFFLDTLTRRVVGMWLLLTEGLRLYDFF